MRDVLVLAVVFGAIPFILRQPHVGILLWSWISYMNPHKMTWGIAPNFPVAAIAGAVTLVAVLASKEKVRLPANSVIAIWIIFIVFLTVTTFVALYPAEAWQQWDKVMKIQVFAILTVALINSPERVRQLVWIIVVSLGYFGIKGGLYTLRTGGGKGLVWGPPGGFIEGNNELALALVMVLPLMVYLRRWEDRRVVKVGLTIAIALTVVSILGSFSRGALLAIVACITFLGLKSRQRGVVLAAALVGVMVTVAVLPATWWERMGTITTYEEDGSAMGRIEAWKLAVSVANARPLGAGFMSFRAETYQRYQTAFNKPQDAHSIYFKVLGEHGWIGLALFIGLFGSTWRLGTRTIRETEKIARFERGRDLIRMLQVSLVGYAVGGAFLGLTYFDLPYHFVGLMIILAVLGKEARAGAGQMSEAGHHTPSGRA